jgi:hypothetical protein
MPENASADPPELTTGTEELEARDAWEKILGVRLPAIPAPVLWFEPESEGCLRYSEVPDCRPGRIWLDETYFMGFETDTAAEIHLVVDDGWPYRIAHEELHWALWTTIGDPDHDHRIRLFWDRVRDVAAYIAIDTPID